MAEIGYVKKRSIAKELEESYLDYAMSVIVSRALPDVRDGLKPVHRRVLYTMYELGLRHNSRYRKSAKITGDTTGNYHPHGTVSVYDALARLAQSFSLRYPLAQGQGNFGSLDGDPPAAERYTEARMTKIAEEMLTDIEKNTVDWSSNYDDTRKEPTVLPARVPQFILNGTVGIAVGMATSVPPHNLTEIVDATVHLIDNPKSETPDLFQYIQGPDFPTAGIIYNKRQILEAYSTGRGPIVTRGRAEIVEQKNQFQIIISEIPYQVNKASLVEKMAELVKNKKIEGVKDIRDESDKEGVRIAIDLRSDSYPKKVLNRLYKFTELQKTFHLNMLALTDGIQPQVLSLKEVLRYFIDHRREVVKRRTQFDLDRAKERAHILEGLKKALGKIDAVIKTIKQSRDKDRAHKNLKNKFKFSSRQATAILEMRLQALAGLERKKIENELKEKKELIKSLAFILRSPKRILGVVKKELKEIKDNYGDDRRTKVISSRVGEFSEEELIPEEETIVTMTRDGYIKRTKPTSFKAQKRGGKGIVGAVTRSEDVVTHFFSAKTHDDVLFFTNRGRAFQTKVFEIPEGARTARGRAIVNLLQLSPQEYVTATITLPKFSQKDSKNTAAVSVGAEVGTTPSIESDSKKKYLVMATKNGIIKKVKFSDLQNIRKSGLIVINLAKNDILRWVKPSTGSDDIMLATKEGQSIRFKEKDVRPMGRISRGVAGIRLKEGDELMGLDVVGREKKGKIEYLVISELGYGKRTGLGNYNTQGRGGAGIKTLKVTPRVGKLLSAKVLSGEEDLVVVSRKGHVIRIDIKDIPVRGRQTQGVRIMKLAAGDKVASVTFV